MSAPAPTATPTTPADLPITVVDSLDKIYPKQRVLAQGERWKALTDRFEKEYGTRPTHVVRAPGRVNLIGEHIDYALFGVLPMAIGADVIVAVRARPDTSEVRITNLDDKYSPAAFTPARTSAGAWDVPIDTSHLDWSSYVKAALLGYLKHPISSDTERSLGLDLVYSGTVPAGSGLSSSAAMVIASLLAALVANGKLDRVSKGELVRMSMGAEGNVGVNTGGMDQAASVISTPSSALYVTFHPTLSAEPVPLPHTDPPSAFVIANTLVTSDKATTAKYNYNLRVVETLVGASILARRLNLPVDPQKRITYREVLSLYAKSDEAALAASPDAFETALRDLLEHADRLLGGSEKERKGFTLEEMRDATGLSEDEFRELYLTSPVEPPSGLYQLLLRATHVLSESLRVLAFQGVAREGKPNAASALGAIMNESQNSCRGLYACSCPELDQITAFAREAGAWGSRLTGAGWGGSTVSLVPADQVDTFIKTIREKYPLYKGLSEEELDEAIFATVPSSGACVVPL